MPRFEIIGKLDRTMCKLSDPFTGELVVESCDVPIKSVELQLVRVETCGCLEGYARDGKKTHLRSPSLLFLLSLS